MRVLEDLRSGEIGSEAVVAPRIERLDAGGGRPTTVSAASQRVRPLRVRVEASLPPATRRFSTPLADSAIVVTDNDGDLAGFSDGAAELFGWTEEESLGRPGAMLFEDEAFKEFLPKLARRSLRVTKGYRDPGAIVPGCATRRQSLPRRSGGSMLPDAILESLVGFMMVVRDITEQVRDSRSRTCESLEARYRTRWSKAWAKAWSIVRDGRHGVLCSTPPSPALAGASESGSRGARWRDAGSPRRDVLVEEETLESEVGEIR